MKKILSVFLIIALMALTLAGCGGGTKSETPAAENTSTDPYTIRLGHVTQVAHPFNIAAEEFAKLVSEKSEGRITVEIFPARALGDDRELLEQVMNNTLDMAVVSGPVFSAYTPVVDTLQMPFMLNTYEKEIAAVKTDEFKAILDSLSQFNLKGLALFEGGMRQLASAKGPITSPADLKGLKLRTTQSDLVMNVITTLGGNPNPMAYGEVYAGLQTKVIDGEEINLTSVSAEKHYEVLTDITEIGLFPFPGIVIMNQDMFEGLAKDDQVIIAEAANEAMLSVLGQMPDIDAAAIENITANSEVKILKGVDTAPFVKLVEPIYKEYADKDPIIKAFIDMAKGL